MTEDWQDLPCIIGGSRQSNRIWRRLFGDPGGLYVLHHCGEARCWEPTHFYLGTQSQNLKQAAAEGRLKGHGERFAALNRSRRGKPMDPEAIERGAAKRRGRPMSDEAKAKISATLTGQKKGPWSAERRAAFSAVRKANPPPRCEEGHMNCVVHVRRS